MRRPARMMRLSDRAFTLPELLIAAVILAVALSGLLMLFINCILLNESNRNLTVATSHGEYILEEIRGAGFSGLEAQIVNNNGTPAGWDLDAGQIQSQYNLTALADETISTWVTQSGNPLGVSVQVSWSDRTHRQRQTELQTFITDY